MQKALLFLFLIGIVFSTSARADTLKIPDVSLTGSIAFPDTATLIDTSLENIVVVTATRRAQKTEWVADDHRSIAIKDRRRNSSKSTAELVASDVPARYTDYGGGAIKSISLRGAGSERTLVLIDGKRMGTTEGDIGDLPDEMIEKIEVVEGGQSALYGMDAIGGVVNVITRNPDTGKTRFGVTTTLSSYEPRNGSPRLNGTGIGVTAGRKSGELSWFLGADNHTSDGRFEYTDADENLRVRENDSSLDRGAFAKIGYEYQKLSLCLTGSLRQRNTVLPGMISWPIRATSEKRLAFTALDGSYVASPFLTLRFNGALNQDRTHYLDNSYSDTSFHQDSRHRWNRRILECVQEFTLGNQKITTGAQGLWHSVKSNEIGSHSANQGSVFAGAILEQNLADITLNATPSIRYDYSSIFDGKETGKIGLLTRWNGFLKPAAFFTLGTSYRSPSFDVLYWPQDLFAVGNPDLKPEQSRNLDGGMQIEHRSGAMRLSCRASAFRVMLEEMIVWQPREDWLFSPVNIASASINGASFKASADFSSWHRTTFDLTYTNARDDETEKVLIYRPEYVMTYSNTLTLDRFSAGVVCRYASMVYADTGNTRTLPAHLKLDANIGVEAVSFGTGGARLVYDALNILNERIYTNEGYPLPGREHRLSVKLEF